MCWANKCNLLLAAILYPLQGQAAEYEVPLFFSADNLTHVSFLDLKRDFEQVQIKSVDDFHGRVPEPSRITIMGYDDEGQEYGPIYLEPPEDDQWRGYRWPILYSQDIQSGNPGKGLRGGLGDGVGEWRLILTTEDPYLQVHTFAGSRTGSVFAPMDMLARTYRHWSGTHHIVPLVTGPGDPYRTSIVRIINRMDHYVRVELSSQRFGLGSYCDMPPRAVMTMEGHEVRDIFYSHEGPAPGENMELEVRAMKVEPDYTPSGMVCENYRDGWHDYGHLGTGGDTHFVGVMAFQRDAEANLVNLLSTPSRNLDLPLAAWPQRNVWGDFNITLHFPEDMPKSWREATKYAAARWEQVLTADYPAQMVDNLCGDRIGSREIDDFLVRVRRVDTTDRGNGGSCTFEEGRAVTGQVNIGYAMPEEVEPDFFQVVDKVLVHEIGHALGFGVGPRWDELVEEHDGSLSFTGANAIEQFEMHFPEEARLAKEEGYTGVPMYDRAHLGVDGEGHDLVRHEVMAEGVLLTPVAIGAMEDIGYTVNYDAADPLP